VPDNRYVLVSSWDQIKEIDEAPYSVLSLQAAAKEILQPKHTMAGFDWHDRKGFDGAPLLKSIGVLLKGHLPHILPEIRQSMSVLLDELKAVNGNAIAHFKYCSMPLTDIADPKGVAVYHVILKAVTHSNAYSFFGKELCKLQRISPRDKTASRLKYFISWKSRVHESRSSVY
jgi:hypothetical protein